MNEILKIVKRKIHSFFILKENGTCIYNRNFSSKFEKLDIDLVTNFFAAFSSFAEEVTSEKIEVLEMANVKLVFISSKDLDLKDIKENLIFATIADIDENNVFLKDSLAMITTHFYNVYKDNLTSLDTAVFHSDELDTIIDSIILGNWEIDSYKDYYRKVETLLDDLIHEDEFLGAALLSVTGTSIYSTLSEKLLSRTLKELDIRLQLGYLDLPLMIYVLKNGDKVVTKEIVNQEFLILLYSATVPLGMCEITANNIATKIEKIYKNWC